MNKESEKELVTIVTRYKDYLLESIFSYFAADAFQQPKIKVGFESDGFGVVFASQFSVNITSGNQPLHFYIRFLRYPITLIYLIEAEK